MTSYITQENSIVQSAVKTLIGITIPSSAGIASDRTIPALAALYTFVTFAASGAFSAAGQAMGRKAGLDTDRKSHTFFVVQVVLPPLVLNISLSICLS